MYICGWIKSTKTLTTIKCSKLPSFVEKFVYWCNILQRHLEKKTTNLMLDDMKHIMKLDRTTTETNEKNLRYYGPCAQSIKCLVVHVLWHHRGYCSFYCAFVCLLLRKDCILVTIRVFYKSGINPYLLKELEEPVCCESSKDGSPSRWELLLRDRTVCFTRPIEQTAPIP